MTKRIVAAGLARPEDIVGCTAEEIRALEIIHEVKLPRAYRDFLAAMGHGTGRVFNPWEGYGVLFHNIKFLNWQIRFQQDLFQPDLPPPPPETAFFIGTFQSMDYWFIDLTDTSNDPPVWGWGDSWLEDNDTKGGCRQLYVSVWEWVEADLETRIDLGMRLARMNVGEFDDDRANDLKAIHDLLLRGVRERWDKFQRRWEAARDNPDLGDEMPF